MENQQAIAEQLFGEALDMPREQRASFLAEACRNAPDVQRLVEALLEENDRLSGYLSDSPYKEADTAAARLAPGTRLGRYTIVDQLGSGGMGVVYRARDEKLERVVAIKMLSRGVLEDEEARRRFRREALAKLNHPHIASVYDVGEQDNTDFLVMELVQGESLAARLRLGTLPVKEATAIARQVAEALEEAHEHGVVHRDLKPANVMITPKGDAKVLDFGVARLLATGGDAATTATAHLGIAGTPAYMSPKQALGKPVDARTDLWSLGVVYYQSLTGRPPFAGASSLEVLHAITAEPLPPIRALRPDLPPLAEFIVTRALEKDSNLRYQSAADMATDLKRLARDLDPGQSPSISTAQPAVPPATAKSRRRRFWMWAAAVALVLLVAWLLRPALPPPQVIEMTQLTQDGAHKTWYQPGIPAPMFTDGSRIYFQELYPDHWALMQVSAEGGETVPINLPWNTSALEGVSPDGLDLLVSWSETQDPGMLWTLPLPGLQPRRRVGNLLASIQSSTWSPDGSLIYYASPQSDRWEISVAGADGSNPRRLFTVAAQPMWLRVSPDGRLLRFTLADNGYRPVSLWEAHTDGSHLRQLLPGWDKGGRVCCGSWTPDGKYFVFQAIRNGISNLWAMRETGDLWRKVSFQPVQLTHGEISATAPLLSRDGKRIFLIGLQFRGEVMRYDLRTHSMSPLLPGLSAEGLSFSKDGRNMAYTSYPGGILWQSTVNGGDRVQLTSPPMVASLPRWSPDGSQIAFTAHDPGKPAQVFLISAGGGAPQQLTSGDVESGDAVWSPDGNSLAYAESGSDLEEMHMPIYILDMKTRQVTAVPGSAGLFSPRWSPDGRYLLAMPRDGSKIMLYDLTRHSWQQLNKVKVDVSYPTWTSNSRCIDFNSNHQKGNPECEICLADRTVRHIADMTQADNLVWAEYGNWTGLAPDGSILATRDISTQEIYALDLKLP